MIYNSFKLIVDYCNIKAILHYIKMCFIQAPLEAALSFFTLESLFFYTNIFIFTKNENWKRNLDTSSLIFYPIAICTLVCLIYVLIVIFLFLFFLFFIASNISKCEKSNLKIRLKMYRIIDNISKKYFLFIHCSGATIYFFLSLIMSSILTSKFHYWRNSEFVKFTFTVCGSVLGVLWNFSGYFVDRSIHWSKVFNCLGENKIRANKCILEGKFKNWFKYTIFHLFLVIVFGFLFFFILIKMNPDLWGTGEDIGPIHIFSSSFIVGSAITLIIFYFKITYMLHYNSKTSGVIYITLYDFLKDNKI